MSDLVNQTALNAPSEGQAQPASGEATQSAAVGQPSEGQAAKDFENIQTLQRIKDKEIKDLRSSFAQQQQYAQQQIAAMQQRLAQMEDSAAPDDYTRLELKLKRAEETAQQYAQAYQQTLQERQAETARQNALREVADEFEVSVKDLEEATDYVSAVKLAVKAQQERSKRKQTEQDDKRERNMPDIGSGAPRTADSEWERKYNEARSRKDTVEQMRLLREKGT
jgi:hypothetical protein